MTKKLSPKRANKQKVSVLNFVWGNISNEKKELGVLRTEVDKAMVDPSYSIVANYEVHWDEVKLNSKRKPRAFWSEDLTDEEVDDLRDQIHKALLDPNYAIVTNYPVTVQF